MNAKELESMSADQLFSLIHQIMDEMCGVCALNAIEYVPSVWSTETLFTVFVDHMKTLLWQMIDIRAKHEWLEQMSDSVHKVVKECVEVRRPELRKAIVNHTMAHNNPVLKDFFWRLNVVLDSDRMSQVNQPIVNLDLNITDGSNGAKRDTFASIELNRQELVRVIDTLEEAQQALRQSY